MSNKDAIKKYFINIIARITIIGDMSIPIEKPRRRLIGLNTGSVTEWRKRTIGL
jgi:hypothetical protein